MSLRTSEQQDGTSEIAALRRSLDLLWHGHTPAGKGPRPGLSLETIIAAAIEIADAEGLEALSMRRLARELGASTMSLYRYVPSKTELLYLMLDRVWAPSPERRKNPPVQWREALAAEARDSRAQCLRHPWLLQVNVNRPVLGPSAIAAVETVMTGLRDLPMTDREKIAVISALDAYVQGSVRQEIMYQRSADESGIAEEDFWAAQLPYLEQAMASGEYPVMAGIADDSFDAGWDETFELGLECLLDGLARRLGEGNDR